MAMLLSFSMTSRLVFSIPELFSPSNASPAVIDPSPITATICRSSSFLNRAAFAIPNAADIDVEECPTPKESYSLSVIFGNPLIPLYFRFV